mmetsp:Transcript_112174/g.324067  ORF Transcript_112174/g.324067 Transcript_112174/m.324067 type:complete len:277 (-) Transcript_112174:236-1066(-)
MRNRAAVTAAPRGGGRNDRFGRWLARRGLDPPWALAGGRRRRRRHRTDRDIVEPGRLEFLKARLEPLQRIHARKAILDEALELLDAASEGVELIAVRILIWRRPLARTPSDLPCALLQGLREHGLAAVCAPNLHLHLVGDRLATAGELGHLPLETRQCALQGADTGGGARECEFLEAVALLLRAPQLRCEAVLQASHLPPEGGGEVVVLGEPGRRGPQRAAEERRRRAVEQPLLLCQPREPVAGDSGVGATRSVRSRMGSMSIGPSSTWRGRRRRR